MPRMPRVHVEEGLYLVTVRGDHGNAIFKDDADKAQYIELLEKCKEQYPFTLFSYVLMPSFVHILLEPPQGITVSKIMHNINSSYTKYFNARYKRRGHLFQERFRSVLAEKDVCLSALTRYIHILPVRSGASDKPDTYEWSSCRYYFGKEGKDPFEISESAKEVLNKLSSDRSEQHAMYAEYVNSAKDDIFDSFRKKLRGAKILGSKEFVERIKEKIEKKAARKNLAGPARRFNRTFALAGGGAALIFITFTLYFYVANLGLEGTLEKKNAEFKQQLVETRLEAKKDLEEKYRADMVSYGAAVKRLEIEKKRQGKSNGNAEK